MLHTQACMEPDFRLRHLECYHLLIKRGADVNELDAGSEYGYQFSAATAIDGDNPFVRTAPM